MYKLIIGLSIIGIVSFWIILLITKSPNNQVKTPTQSIPFIPSPTLPPPVFTPTLTPTLQTIKTRETIDTQEVVIYKPQPYEVDAPLVIYAHGSNEQVTEPVVPAGFAIALESYGNYIASQGGFFIASEMYGENWGSKESREHLKNIIEFFSTDVGISGPVYLFGFSMGGLPALRFANDYPDFVETIALIAPTVRLEDWDQISVGRISDIPITIWHGTKDVNIPVTSSRIFYNHLLQYQHSHVVFHEVLDETHRHFVEPEELWEVFEGNS